MTLAFLDTDPESLKTSLLAAFETEARRRLEPAQVENLLLHTLAYAAAVWRQEIVFCAEQNLVAFASGEHLDRLGDLLGAPRLQPAAATTRLRFTVSSGGGMTLPKGIRVCPEGEGPAFRTLAPLVIPGGITVAEVAAEAELTGPRPNGLAPGSLTRIDPVIPGLSVTSTTSATGGTLLEEDEPYRARLLAAPARFSSAGSAGAYRFHALSASPDVLDALATSPSPLNVAVYVLAKGGLPSSDLLDQVRLALNADTVRPIADAVAVLPASRLPFRITAALTLLETADPVATLAQAQAAAQALVTNRRTALGRDVTPSQVQAALFVPGVYHVALTEPAVVLEVGASSFADCEAIQLTLAGVAHG